MFILVLFIIATFENNSKSSKRSLMKNLDNNYMKSIRTCIAIWKIIYE